MTDAEITKLVIAAQKNPGRGRAQQSGFSGQTILLIVAMFLSALGPTLTGAGAWLNSRASVSSAEAARISNAETASEVKKIHVAVNSERTAMMASLKEANDTILVLSKELATLRAQVRPLLIPGAAIPVIPLPAEPSVLSAPIPTVPAPRQSIVENKVDQNTEGLKELLEELKQYRSKLPISAGEDAGKPALRTTEK